MKAHSERMGKGSSFVALNFYKMIFNPPSYLIPEDIPLEYAYGNSKIYKYKRSDINSILNGMISEVPKLNEEDLNKLIISISRIFEIV
jgi:hypothetical protein